MPGAGSFLALQGEGEFADERLYVILVPAELLADAALVEVGEFGHLGGGELVDFAVGAPEFDGVVLHLHVQPLEDARLPSTPGAW